MNKEERKKNQWNKQTKTLVLWKDHQTLVRLIREKYREQKLQVANIRNNEGTLLEVLQTLKGQWEKIMSKCVTT